MFLFYKNKKNSDTAKMSEPSFYHLLCKGNFLFDMSQASKDAF